MDETLIHTSTRSLDKGYDLKILINDEDGRIVQAKVFMRPHLQQFLDRMSAIYELVLFTASQSFYADKVLNALDPESMLLAHVGKYFSLRLYRDDCTEIDDRYGDKVLVKDVAAIIARDPDQYIIVDDNPSGLFHQLDCLVPIIPYRINKSDTELIKLADLLEHLNEMSSHTSFLKSYFKLDSLLKVSDFKDLVSLHQSHQ